MAEYNERMIFNYPLPTEYYPQSHNHPGFFPQWAAPTSPHSSVPRTVPTGAYVDPRKLQRSYLSSSDEYHRNTRSPTTNSPKQRVHPMVLHQSNGHQPAYVPTGYSELSGGRRGISHRTLHPQSSLPSPPLSPHPPSTTYPTITTSTYHHDHDQTSNRNRQHQYRISPTLLSPTSPTIISTSRHFCTHHTCIDPSTSRSLKSFSRHADLIRHHKSLHGNTVDEEGKIKPMAKYDCPRSRCNRKGPNGFTRLDHLTEHRRGYHGEDIPRRRTSASGTGLETG